jgi:hypothetical protein
MAKRNMPPVPPEARSDKARDARAEGRQVADTAMAGNRPEGGRNPAKQDRQDIDQNTTHQGYQQDR